MRLSEIDSIFHIKPKTMQNDEWITGKISVSIGGTPLEMEMTVPTAAVKPQRMLPVFQQMSSSIVGLSINAIELEGEKISCRAGCGACCRQPVPVSEIEIYQLAELVEKMAEPCRSEIKKRFADGTEKLRDAGWFARMKEFSELDEDTPYETRSTELIAATLDYFQQNIACPFLEDESCSIHAVRPLVCREYLVTSPPENCTAPTAETIKKVPLLLKPSKVLREIAQTEISARLGFATLIESLEIAKQFPENFPVKSGEMWVKDFFEILSNTEIPPGGIPPNDASSTSNVGL